MTTKFFERPQSGERAVLVHASPDGLPDESEREEFAELAHMLLTHGYMNGETIRIDGGIRMGPK